MQLSNVILGLAASFILSTTANPLPAADEDVNWPVAPGIDPGCWVLGDGPTACIADGCTVGPFTCGDCCSKWCPANTPDLCTGQTNIALFPGSCCPNE